MELPAFYAQMALERLQHPASEPHLGTIFDMLGLELIEPGPAPDFEGLRSRFVVEQPGKASEGVLTFSGELAVLGVQLPLHFRITYVGEFGAPDEIWDDFSYVSELHVLTWSPEGRSPEWTKLDAGVFAALPIRQAMDELVLGHEAARQIGSKT